MSLSLPKKSSISGQGINEPQNYQRALSWLTCWASLAFAVLLAFARLSYGLLLPAMHADLQASYSVLGTIATINFVGYLLGMLAMPWLLAHVRNHIRLNLIALLAVNLLMLAAASSATIWQLGIWRLCTGFAGAVATVLTMALTLECILPQERGQASGIIWLGAGIGLILSGLIAPPIISAGAHGGWRLVWIVMGIVGVIVAFGFFITRQAHTPPVVKREPAEVSASQQPTLWATLRSLLLPHRMLWLALAYFGFGGGYITYFTFFITLLEHQGVPVLYAGFVWAAIGIAATLSAWIWGRLFDRWPNGFTLMIALAVGMFGMLAVLTGVSVIEYIGGAIVGLSALLAPPIMITVLLKQVVSDEAYAANYSALTAVFAVGQILGPFVGGIVIGAFNLQAGIVISAVMLGIATFCACAYGVVQRKRMRG